MTPEQQGQFRPTSATPQRESSMEGSFNQNQSARQNPPKDGANKLGEKIQKTWPQLSPEEVALYTAGKQDQFFKKLEEKYGLDREEAEDKLKQCEQSCGSDRAA